MTPVPADPTPVPSRRGAVPSIAPPALLTPPGAQPRTEDETVQAPRVPLGTPPRPMPPPTLEPEAPKRESAEQRLARLIPSIGTPAPVTRGKMPRSSTLAPLPSLPEISVPTPALGTPSPVIGRTVLPHPPEGGLPPLPGLESASTVPRPARMSSPSLSGTSFSNENSNIFNQWAQQGTPAPVQRRIYEEPRLRWAALALAAAATVGTVGGVLWGLWSTMQPAPLEPVALVEPPKVLEPPVEPPVEPPEPPPTEPPPLDEVQPVDPLPAEAPPLAKETPPPEPPPKPIEKPAKPPAEKTVPQMIDAAWAEMDRGDPFAAATLFKKALSQSPGNTDANYGLGYVLLRQGKKGDALTHLCKALANARGDSGITRDVNGLLSANEMSCP